MTHFHGGATTTARSRDERCARKAANAQAHHIHERAGNTNREQRAHNGPDDPQLAGLVAARTLKARLTRACICES